mmetsp:Transcript_10818/g.45410  ORF Transcript_10818/g.45410 Transcript_10818/m.45410 type:complete len:256 (+) Transcript_10818:2336-3103(+)
MYARAPKDAARTRARRSVDTRRRGKDTARRAPLRISARRGTRTCPSVCFLWSRPRQNPCPPCRTPRFPPNTKLCVSRARLRVRAKDTGWGTSRVSCRRRRRAAPVCFGGPARYTRGSNTGPAGTDTTNGVSRARACTPPWGTSPRPRRPRRPRRSPRKEARTASSRTRTRPRARGARRRPWSPRTPPARASTAPRRWRCLRTSGRVCTKRAARRRARARRGRRRGRPRPARSRAPRPTDPPPPRRSRWARIPGST